MKTLACLFTCLMLIVSNLSYGQVDDIKKGANSNKKQGSGNNQGVTGESSGGKDSNEACVEACCELIGSQVFQIMLAAIVEGQYTMLSASENDPTIRSFDFDPQGAYNPRYESYLILPRIRGTYGIFATDFRLNYLLGKGKNGTETFKTYEWQILQFNLVSLPHVNFRIGSGVYWQNYLSPEPNEGYVTQSFNEHAAELSIKFNNQKYITTASGRIALDYNTHNTVFSEFSLIQNIRFMQSPTMGGYFSFGINVEKYYETTKLLSIQAGLHFNFSSNSKYVRNATVNTDQNQPPQY